MKSPLTETVIANALLGILERLDKLEHAANVLLGNNTAGQYSATNRSNHSMEQAVLLERLAKLTLKRHAVLTATLGGQSYQAIAKAMQCDVTTVKLHLKAALSILEIKSRSQLLAQSPALLARITDQGYKSQFGIGKQWWQSNEPSVLMVLQTKKPTRNQYTPKA